MNHYALQTVAVFALRVYKRAAFYSSIKTKFQNNKIVSFVTMHIDKSP